LEPPTKKMSPTPERYQSAVNGGSNGFANGEASQ
jgi:hypothetical protein